MADFEVPAVAEIARDLPAVLRRLRSGSTFPFSFGDGRPEAVVLTYDEFEDLDGESRIPHQPDVATIEQVASELERMIVEIRSGSFIPMVWTDGAEPRLMIMSSAQYRDLRGDDHPPEGVDDDPTKRTYVSAPLPTSRPLDPWEADDEYTQRILDEIRAEKDVPPDQS